MKKLTMIIAAVVMGFVMTSCGNKEKELMQKATEFYTQAETELKAIDNFDGLTAFFQNFKQKFDDFTATYSDMKLSQETQGFLSNKAEAFKTLETQKAVELFTPYLEQMKKTFNQCSMLDMFLLSDEGKDKAEEKMLKMLGVDPAASEEEMKNSMAAALGIDPTTTSDEEGEKAMLNWMVSNLGITVAPNASEEEIDKAVEEWMNTNLGIDPNASDEETKNAIENWMTKNKEALDSFVKSYDEIGEILPEDLKESAEKLKKSITENK